MWLLLLGGQAQAAALGMDVSRWQGTIDWETAQNHIDFTIIKAGGSDVGLYTDRQFVRNRDEARRLGIPRGYYYFAGGGDPVREAEHFAAITGELLPGEVVAMDMEIDTPDPVAYSLAFLKRTEQLLGVKPMLYTNMNRVWGNDWQPVARSGYPLWGAIFDHDYENFPEPGAWPQVSVKQFTSKGSIPGVSSQYVDLNVIRGDAGVFQGLGKPEPQPPVGAPTAPGAVAAEKPKQDSSRPKPGYMGGLGDGRRNSLDSGQTPPMAELPDEPEAAEAASAQEQAIATESHKDSAAADNYGVDEGGLPSAADSGSATDEDAGSGGNPGGDDETGNSGDSGREGENNDSAGSVDEQDSGSAESGAGDRHTVDLKPLLRFFLTSLR